MDDNIYLQTCTGEQEIDLLYTRRELWTAVCSLMPCLSGTLVACRSPPLSSCHAADGWRAASRAAEKKRK